MVSSLPVVHQSAQITPAMQIPHLAIEGLEGLTQRDVVVPRWSLVQPTSRMEGADEHIGQFRRNIDGQFRKTLDVIVLKVDPSRLKWPANTNEGRPECFSRDGLRGTLYGSCGTCRFNIGANPSLLAAVRNGEDPELCSYGYTLMIVDDLQAETAALLGVMGTSVRPTKEKLISIFARKRKPPFSALVRIASEKGDESKGKYRVLTYEVQKWLDDKETDKWRDLYRSFKGAVIEDIDEDEVFAPSTAARGNDDNPLNQPDEDGEQLPF